MHINANSGFLLASHLTREVHKNLLENIDKNSLKIKLRPAQLNMSLYSLILQVGLRLFMKEFMSAKLHN